MHAHTPPFTKPTGAYDSRRLFPEDSAERKEYPVYSGALQYFPSALAAVANHSFKGNEKHNPGQPLHHDRAKSGDEADALMRHLMEGDYVGMAWRALALLQKHLEANGAPIAPGARNVQGVPTKGCLAELVRETQSWGMYADADIPAKTASTDLAPKWSPQWLAEQGVPAESSYLASFSPNDLQAETLREYGIGDVTRHPMHAEALRDEYEKADGETGV